jgi:hypothetical protein
MKNIIAAVLIATSTMTLTTTPVYAVSAQQCELMGELVGLAATARDGGVAVGAVYDILITGGLSDKLAIEVINTVYLVGADYSPAVLEALFLSYCKGDAA